MRRRVPALLLGFACLPLVAQTAPPVATPAPAATPVPAQTPVAAATPPPMTDLRFLRMKISAGDLPSAESILETHRAEKGDDAETLMCVAWLARGAALLGDWPAASRYAKEARTAAVSRLGNPRAWEDNSEAAYALGTAIEVEAQALEAAGKKADAIRLLDESAKSLESEKAPYNLRARVRKRRNQLELVGQPAPGFRVEDSIGAPAPSLDSLRGKPVVMFFWWESCGDCRAQAPDGQANRREVLRPRRVRRADARLRRRPVRREGEDREDLEGDLRDARVHRGADQRRGDAPVRSIGDADVRVRRPQGRRAPVPSLPDDRGAPRGAIDDLLR